MGGGRQTFFLLLLLERCQWRSSEYVILSFYFSLYIFVGGKGVSGLG